MQERALTVPTILALNNSSTMKIIANGRRRSFVTQQRYQNLRLCFFQAAILLIIIISSLAKLFFYEVPGEEVPLFMSLVGPGDSSKTRLIFAMLASLTTFHPSFKEPIAQRNG